MRAFPPLKERLFTKMGMQPQNTCTKVHLKHFKFVYRFSNA